MRRLLALPRPSHVLALCAVALLNFAGVRSTLMQVSMAQAVDTCMGATPAMAAMAPDAPQRPAKGKSDRSCEFCAAAAHAPIQSASVVLPAPSHVAWSPVLAWSRQGPRGPPAREAHARGPPLLLPI